VQLAQLRARVHAQLLGRSVREPLVRLERRRPPFRPVQREHQLRDEPFTERLRVGQRGQLGDDLVVMAHLQLRVELGLQDREAQLGQLRRGHPAAEVGECRATPQRVRLVEQLRPT
jgi:hypothetical protein